MDITKSVHYISSLRASEKNGTKGMFKYGEQQIPEILIKEAAQDIYNRLTGHGLSYGALVLIFNIVQCQLRDEAYSSPL